MEKLEDELNVLSPLDQKDAVHTQKKWRNYVPTTLEGDSITQIRQEEQEEVEWQAFLRSIGFKGLLFPRKRRHAGKPKIRNCHGVIDDDQET